MFFNITCSSALTLPRDFSPLPFPFFFGDGDRVTAPRRQRVGRNRNAMEVAGGSSSRRPSGDSYSQASATDGEVEEGKQGGISNGPVQEADHKSNLDKELEAIEINARVLAVWEKMNTGKPFKMLALTSRPIQEKKTTGQKTPDWMIALGIAPKRESASQETLGKRPAAVHNCSSEEARRAAAAALSAVREGALAEGKVEITEVRDFAGQEIEVRKIVDANSREAVEKAKAAGAQPSALDTILDQIKKKQKLSVLDKTKKDWGEFKEEHKGLEEELDTYKKSSNQYLDKVSFLQRTDLREFERERDARLALHAKRRPADMREDEI